MSTEPELDPHDEAPSGVETPVRSARKRDKKPSYGRWVALGLLVVAIGLIGSTLRGTAVQYSKYVDEVMAPGEARHWVGRTLRVEGLVAPGSIESRPGTSEYRFRVARNHAEMPVHYRGIVPDTFRDCAGVTVRGELTESGTFNADEIIAKCPSRYEAATVVNGQCVVGMTPERGANGQPLPQGGAPIR